MRLVTLVILASAAAGCGGPAMPRERLAECFAQAAYACYVAESRGGGESSPEKPCCGQCNGTGKVLSGDRLALVDCECDSSCPCKSKSCAPGKECAK